MGTLSKIVLTSIIALYSLNSAAQDKIRDFINETAEHVDLTIPPMRNSNGENRWKRTEYTSNTKTIYFLDDLLEEGFPPPQKATAQEKDYFARSIDKDGRVVRLRQVPIYDSTNNVIGYSLAADTIPDGPNWNANECDAAEVHTGKEDDKGRPVKYTTTIANAFEGKYYEIEYSVIYNTAEGHESEIEMIRCNTALDSITTEGITSSRKERTIRFIREDDKHRKLISVEISADICGTHYDKKLGYDDMKDLFTRMENDLMAGRYPQEYFDRIMRHIEKIDVNLYKIMDDVSCY